MRHLLIHRKFFAQFFACTGFLGLVILLLGIACANCESKTLPPSQPVQPIPTPHTSVQNYQIFDLFAFGRILGTVAPCGCTTEPLGGLQYVFGYIESHSQASSRLILEPGSLLFPAEDGPEYPSDEASWAQAEQRASLLQNRLHAFQGHHVSGLGPADLHSPHGKAALERWPLPRVIANVKSVQQATVTSHRMVELGSSQKLKVGVTAVIDPKHPQAKVLGQVEDPVAALERELPRINQAGAHLSVVMVLGEQALAEAIIEAVPNIDVLIVGIAKGLEQGRVGAPVRKYKNTWILTPGEQAQTLSHLRIWVLANKLAGVLPPNSDWYRVPSHDGQNLELQRLDEKLAKFSQDPSADPQYIARLQQERDKLATQSNAPHVPTHAVEVRFEQVKITCHLQADAQAKAALQAYDQWIATQNKARFAGVQPPQPKPGQASYVGQEECSTCHDQASQFWQRTRHANAYKTLVDSNKQYDVNCVGCHVTGFRQPGGSEVVENAHLQAIQCEQCHGPGSLHVEEPTRRGKAYGITLQTPESLCLSCHTPEHSDTFAYIPYLRDVLGAGHGEQARKQLGDGPTGRELRAAGFAKAGGACKNK